MEKKTRVLFICTHNSVRSQMAEGLLNTLYGDRYKAYSSGTQPTVVNPYAVKVMGEIGIDISTHQSKSVDEFTGETLDIVVTVCDKTKQTCPIFPGAKKNLHMGFGDPSEFTGTKEEKLTAFRELRDEIKQWVQKTFCEII